MRDMLLLFLFYNRDLISPNLALQIMDLFTSHLSLSTTKTNIAKFLAYNIEASIDALHCSIQDSKSYIAKARSLSYNLKRNEVRKRIYTFLITRLLACALTYASSNILKRLRSAILDGDLAPEDLVKLSPNELATEEQKDARDAESKASTLERRADYYQIARAGIQVQPDGNSFFRIPIISAFSPCVLPCSILFSIAESYTLNASNGRQTL